MRKKQRICHRSIEQATDENLFGNCCCRWTAANFCHPVQRCGQQIGGESDILEGDESQFGKCKYSRGSRIWTFPISSSKLSQAGNCPMPIACPPLTSFQKHITLDAITINFPLLLNTLMIGPSDLGKYFLWCSDTQRDCFYHGLLFEA